MGVVITDGKSSEPQLTEWEAKLAHDDGIDVFAIGIQCLIYNVSTIIWYIYMVQKGDELVKLLAFPTKI